MGHGPQTELSRCGLFLLVGHLLSGPSHLSRQRHSEALCARSLGSLTCSFLSSASGVMPPTAHHMQSWCKHPSMTLLQGPWLDSDGKHPGATNWGLLVWRAPIDWSLLWVTARIADDHAAPIHSLSHLLPHPCLGHDLAFLDTRKVSSNLERSVAWWFTFKKTTIDHVVIPCHPPCGGRLVVSIPRAEPLMALGHRFLQHLPTGSSTVTLKIR